MTMFVGSQATQARGIRTWVAVLAVTTAGVAFNVFRIQVGLDHRPLWCSLVAFAGLGTATAMGAWWLPVTSRQLGLARPTVVPFFVGSLLVVAAVMSMAIMTAPITRVPSAAQLAGGVVLFAGFTGPAEELLFRGLLYGIVDAEHGPVAATVVTAVSFAVVHVPAYGIASLPVAVAAGLLFGWLRCWCGSLAGPWLVHSVADLSLLWL